MSRMLHFPNLATPVKAALASAFLWMTLSAGPASAQDAPTDPAGLGGVIQTNVEQTGRELKDDLIQKARAAGWSESQISSILLLIDALEQENLPTHTAIDRARQGVVKKASPDRVIDVIEDLKLRIRLAGLVVDGRFPSGRAAASPDVVAERLDLIDRASFAIEKGVTSVSLQSLMQSIRATGREAEQIDALDAPVFALTSVVAGGVDSDQSVSVKVIVKAHEKGIQGKELENLGRLISEAIRQVPPQERAELIRQILADFERNVPPGEIVSSLHKKGGHHHRPGFERPPRRGDQRPADDPGRRGRSQRDGRGGGPP